VRLSGILKTTLGAELFASAYFLYKRREDHLSDLLHSYPGLVRGGNVLDVGTNIGYTAGVLSRAIDPDRVVYAFEPEPFNFGMLERMTTRPEFAGRILCRQFAIGAQDGTVQLWLNRNHHADHRIMTDRFQRSHQAARGITVPLVSIDTFLTDHPGPVSFIKIDVQGFEQAVCEGMKRMLERNAAVKILLEYAPAGIRALGFDPSDLTAFLRGYGFRCSLIGPKGSLSPGPPATMKEFEYVDLLFSRDPITTGGEM
jgi:FkbM family methyltransferase